MRFFSCTDEGSILAHVDGGALLAACGASASDTVNPEKPFKLRVFSPNELDTATGGFAKDNLLGKGSHGCLYKGTLKDGKLVGVKRQEYLQDEAAFSNELDILSTLRSHRFVNLVGFSRGFDAQDKLLVVDYMPNGTLQDALQNAEGPLGWSMRVQIATQTAKAILALHSANPPVVHRDVKSSNVHLDARWNAKLGDFGLALRGAVAVEDIKRASITKPGPGKVGSVVLEPETTPRIGTKIDVFSFGVLLLEIISGRNAIDSRLQPPKIIDWALPLIKQGKAHAIYDSRVAVLPQHGKSLRLMTRIASRCLRRTGVRRPSMSYVVAGLEEVCKALPLPKWLALATVLKRGANRQSRYPNLKANPDFQDLIGSPEPALFRRSRVAALDGTTDESNPPERLMRSMRLRDQRTRTLHRTLSQSRKEEEASKERRRGTLDFNRTSCHPGRKSVLDMARSSPEMAFQAMVFYVRPTHRPGLSDWPSRSRASEEVIAAARQVNVVEGSSCMPSKQVRSQTVKSSSRQSHNKTRDNFEREEAMLPW